MRQIKSRARVRDAGEVFTAPREVNAMLDLLPADVFADLDSTFLEPTCGQGAFLVEVLRRKLKHCRSVTDTLRALSSIYGIDIARDQGDRGEPHAPHASTTSSAVTSSAQFFWSTLSVPLCRSGS